MNKRSISLTTIIFSSFGLFYSLIGIISFLASLNATSNVCLYGLLSEFSKENSDLFCLGTNEIIRGAYDVYLVSGIAINILFLLVSQIVEFKKGKYSVSYIIFPLISLLVSIIPFILRGRISFFN